MIQDNPSRSSISVMDILRALAAKHRLLLAGAIVGALAAGGATLLMTPVYRAEALVAPVSADGAEGLSGAGARAGGLASLAGLGTPGSGDREVEAIATLQSRTLTQSWIEENSLLPVLYSDRWNPRTNSWNSSDPKKIPSLWDANNLVVRSVRKVTQDKRTGLVTISIEWKDPAVAASWAMDLISRTNQLLRSRAIERSERNIAFLQHQLEVTSVLEMRRSIYQLLETQIKNIMIAQGSQEYAFKLIDPAAKPERSSSPNRILSVALGLIGGLVLTAVFVLIRSPLE